MNDDVVDAVGQQVEVPGASGRAFRVARGKILRITDLDGFQVADLVAYSSENTSEMLSQGFTRMYNSSVNLQQGDRLFSNQNRPVWTIVHDDVGVHDRTAGNPSFESPAQELTAMVRVRRLRHR